ncbi:hypothetical protein [Roseimicrobium sp. ORNL1]|uniref:hypothetical protein n=1 Tax=Roseimicrobium sp. ORNL1 TaxID=2711231 RepID=UPI0013E20197|nr:hypothetical protein [Roseimicrobium sp. ORNL1]QIF05215.1 hypothetical protein G5S37_28120 [Roseimicrobium sp. ORNL1]
MSKCTLAVATAVIAIVVIVGVIVSPGCGSRLSPVSPRGAAELAMKNFAVLLAEWPSEQRKNLTSIQQLYRRSENENGWGSFRTATWSHVEWETVGRPRFDYVVHPNRTGIPDEEAILIATPCEIRIKDGESARVALTHALKVIHIKDPEYHQRVYEQSE